MRDKKEIQIKIKGCLRKMEEAKSEIDSDDINEGDCEDLEAEYNLLDVEYSSLVWCLGDYAPQKLQPSVSIDHKLRADWEDAS